jgi:hypothetical protein
VNVEGDPYPVYIDPMEHWLKANGVDWDRVAGLPEIKIDEQLQTLHVEMFHDDVDGHPTIHRPGGTVYTGLREFPMAVPPDPGWWAAYQHSRPQALRRAELKQLASDLRFPDVEWSQVTVVIPADGDSLMFVTASPIDTEHADSVVKQMEGLLPGVKISVVGGFQTLMHKPAAKPRRGFV